MKLDDHGLQQAVYRHDVHCMQRNVKSPFLFIFSPQTGPLLPSGKGASRRRRAGPAAETQRSVHSARIHPNQWPGISSEFTMSFLSQSGLDRGHRCLVCHSSCLPFTCPNTYYLWINNESVALTQYSQRDSISRSEVGHRADQEWHA